MKRQTRRSRHGFTLAELLIVIAVIGILTAIAIPVFSHQLEEARRAADEANLRQGISLAHSEYLSSSRKDSHKYFFDQNSQTKALEIATFEVDGEIYTASSPTANRIWGASQEHRGQTIYVQIGPNGTIEAAEWTAW